MLNVIIGFLIFFIVYIVYSFMFSMIFLSLFFGIPKTILLKKEKILSKEASIKPYLITAIIWFIISFIITVLLYKFLDSFYNYLYWSVTIAMIKAMSCLRKKYYYTNMQELLKVQADYII